MSLEHEFHLIPETVRGGGCYIYHCGMSYTVVRICKESCGNTTPKYNNCIKSSRPH